MTIDDGDEPKTIKMLEEQSPLRDNRDRNKKNQSMSSIQLGTQREKVQILEESPQHLRNQKEKAGNVYGSESAYNGMPLKANKNV